MPWDRPEINTFIVQPPLKDRSQIIIYLNQLPRSGRDQERLFGLAEIATPENDIKNEIQIFLTQLSTKYQEETVENPGLAFEQTLEWANRILRERFDPKKLADVNLVFGCLKNNTMQFTTLGSVVAQIFFKEKNNYQNIDLLKAYTSNNKTTGQDLFFSNLISGELHHNNFVLFSIPTLLDFLSLERLEKIITQTKPSEICDYLETILNQIESKLAFGGMLIEWPDNDWQTAPIPLPVQIRATPDSSIKQLLKQEADTAKILTPSLFSGLKNLWQNRKQQQKTTPTLPIQPTPEINKDIDTIRKITKIYAGLTGWKGQLRLISQNFLVGLGKLLFNIYNFFKQIPHWTFSISAFKSNPFFLKTLFLKIITHFKKLPPKKLIIVILSSFTIIALIASLTISQMQKKSKIEAENYNQLINNIKNKLDEADSNLIYKNEDQAKAKLKEVAAELSALPKTADTREEMAKKLEANYQEIVQKMQHAQTVTLQTELDLSNTNQKTIPDFLLLSNKNLYLTYSTDSSSITSYNLDTKKVNNTADSRLGNPLSWVTQKDNTILILNKNQKLVQFNPLTNSFDSKDITWAKPDSAINSITVYNGKLYAIDSKNQQISKHNPSTTGFGKGEFWIKQGGLKLDNTTDISIDGNVYVAKNNGEIWRFEMGTKTNLTTDLIAPPLQSSIKISTAYGSDLLFILDNDHKRVIIWNKKTNSLVSQFISTEFTDLRDLAPDEKNKKIYVIDGLKIKSFKY